MTFFVTYKRYLSSIYISHRPYIKESKHSSNRNKAVLHWLKERCLFTLLDMSLHHGNFSLTMWLLSAVLISFVLLFRNPKYLVKDIIIFDTGVLWTDLWKPLLLKTQQGGLWTTQTICTWSHRSSRQTRSSCPKITNKGWLNPCKVNLSKFGGGWKLPWIEVVTTKLLVTIT